MKRFFTIVFIISGVNRSLAQESNKRCTWVTDFGQEIHLDTLSIDPSTITTSVPADFEYSLSTGNFLLMKPEDVDSVEVCFRVFPFDFGQPIATHTLAEYDSTIATPAIYIKPDPVIGREEIFSVDGIQKSGSISRGMSFGNNQDVFVNSTLNLQLDGKLTDDLNIRATITDQNIPFQPEGNTQQLQDFDNVFIQVYNDNFSLTAGDIVLKNKPSQFLRYYKNVQGGQSVVKYNVGKFKAESSAAFSVAKGRFASIRIEATEGLAGPYKLRGPNNERFIIVLANSEKVYLDGKLLERGFNYDYVIDYNVAEITFNHKIIVTKFSRIRVDFEFSDRNYNRSIVQSSHYFESKRADFHFNFYQEKDNKNQPLAFDLSNEDKNLLSQIGDNINDAVVSGADSVVYNENLIMYKQIDTLDLDGIRQDVFKFSINPDSARFIVSFSDVGEGNGDYQLVNNAINGRAYLWVSRINGQPQGRYAPVTPITTPSMKQMMTFGVGLNVTGTDRFYSEVALSNQDINLFSSIGNGDNRGYAVKVGYEKAPIEIGFMPGYKLSGSADFEHDNENFAAIDRFRTIEFNRNWSLPTSQIISSDDNIYNGTLSLRKNTFNKFDYQFSGRQRGNQVSGEQHHLDVSKGLGLLQLNSELFLLNNDRDIQQSEWQRWVGEAYIKSKYIQPGYQYTTDRNKVFTADNDSIFSTAMNYNEHRFFIRNGDSLATRFNMSYAVREDRLPFEGELVSSNRSQTGNLSLGTTIKNNQNLEVTFTYRNLENLRAADGGKRNEETIMGRIDWTGHFLNKHIRSELTYATNNGRELKREFIFLQVSTGEGTHTWRDLNADGVQDLGEFFEAVNFDERNYAKIFVPTDEFIQAFSNLFNYRFSGKMPSNWQSEGGFKAILSKISNVTAVNLDKKITDDDIAARFFPFSNDVSDENLLAIRQSIRSTFFFNRANPGYALDFGINLTDGKQLLTNGIESRKKDKYTLNMRYNLNRSYNFTIRLATSEKSNFSDFLTGRNFIIDTKRIAPEVAWQPSNKFRLSGSYIHTRKSNIFSENQDEGVTSNEMRFDMRLAKAATSSINATFRFISNAFSGDENSALGYELLDALRPGKNATWNFNLQRKLANGLRLTMNYEGRKSPAQKVIHVGRMQVTALF